MKGKGWIGVIIVAVLVLLCPTVGSADIWYNLYDTSTSVGAGSYYQLQLTDNGGGDYHAQLKAITLGSSLWYIDWFAIKFDGGATGIIDGGNTFSGAGTWLVGDGTVSLQNYSPFPNNTWTGGYADGAVVPLTAAGVMTGAQLGATYTWDFDFNLAAALNPTPSLQIGYYSVQPAGNSGNMKSQRLSQYFQVPEPGALLLLGSGLLGLGLFQRKFRK